MLKKYLVATFFSSMMLSNLALGSVHISFMGTAGSIDDQSFDAANEKIAELLKRGAIKKYVLSSIDAEGSAQICVEFIGCTSRDGYYFDFFTKKLSTSSTTTIEISKESCK